MNWQNGWKLAKSDYVKLVPILALAFYMAFIPNLQYPYTIHIDEWVHIAHSNALLRAADIYYPYPFSGQGTGGIVALLELGYHLPLAVFHRLSGVSWMDISRYFPSIVFVFTALSVYIFAKRMGFGWEAAFFTTLIPTTVGIMGPAFMIPVAMGLMFAPLLLFLVFNFRTPWSYLVLSISIALLMILHGTSAILIIMILAPFLLFSLKDDFKHSLLIMLAVAVPLLVTLPWTSDLLLSQGKSLITPTPLPAYHQFLSFIAGYGYLPIASCLLGTFVLAIGGTKKNYGLVIGLLVLLVMLAVFYTLHYGLALLYLRGLLFAMLMMSIVAGAGLMALRKLELPWNTDLRLKKPLIIQAVGILLCLIFIGATLAIAIPARQGQFYYHMIDKKDYEAFVWIRDNVDENYEKAILDPWKATAFTAITGKYVYTRIHTYPMPKDEEARAFLRGGCSDTSFLTENDISIVYNPGSCSNPDLKEVRKFVYMLKELDMRAGSAQPGDIYHID